MHSRTYFTLRSFTAGASVLALTLAGLVFIAAPPSFGVSPATINLGTASSFGVLAKGYVTTGTNSTINGDIGSGAAITTGADNTIRGSVYSSMATTTGARNILSSDIFAGAAIDLGADSSVGGSVYAVAAITLGAGSNVAGSQNPNQTSINSRYPAALTALEAAILDGASRTSSQIPTVLGGTTLIPGVYSAVPGGFLTLTGTLTLDAQNDPNAVFIIRSDGYFTAAASSSVSLINGANPENVFFVVGGYLTLGAAASFAGNILATGDVTFGVNASVQGRIFSKAGFVRFGDNNPMTTYGVVGIGTTLLQAPLVPVLQTPTRTADGFVFSIGNYDAGYSWSGTVTNSGSVLIGGTGVVTVTGLAPSTSATVTIITQRSGYTQGSATRVAASLKQALIPILTAPISDNTGFSFSIDNFDGDYSWAATATNGGSAAISGTGEVTVTGLSASQSSTVLIKSTRAEFAPGTKSITGGSLREALTPNLTVPTRSATGFTFQITNYDSSFTWSGTATNDGLVAINNLGVATVTGLAADNSATVRITASKSGFANGSSTVVASSLGEALIPVLTVPTATATGFIFIILNYGPSCSWSGASTNQGIVVIDTSGNVSVTGLDPDTSAQVTITARQQGCAAGSTAVTATSLKLALSPLFSSPTSANGGFTFQITNYDPSFAWSGIAVNAGLVAISGTGLVTLTGLAGNTFATAAITATKAGFAPGTQSLGGTSLTPSSAPNPSITPGSTAPESSGAFNTTLMATSQGAGLIPRIELVPGESTDTRLVESADPPGYEKTEYFTIAGVLTDFAGRPVAGVTLLIAGEGVLFNTGSLAESTKQNYTIGSISVTTSAKGEYSIQARSNIAGEHIITVVGGEAIQPKVITFQQASGSSGSRLEIEAPKTTMESRFEVTVSLRDVFSNPVRVTDTGKFSLKYEGLGSASGTFDTTDVDGLAFLTVNLDSQRIGVGTVTASYDGDGDPATLGDNLVVTKQIYIGQPAPSRQKITVGTLKGYVVIYALGHQGDRLSAKVGKDWVIVPAIPKSPNFLFRFAEPVGAGVDCEVRVYINRVIVDTVYLTTK